MIGSDDDVKRFHTETAGVFDIDGGEVILPGQGGNTGTGEPVAPDIPIAHFITDELVAVMLALPAGRMAKATGREWWRLDEEEMELLGKTAGPSVRYLAERYLGGAGPFAAMGAALGVIYGPRVIHEMRARQQEKEDLRNGVRRPKPEETYGESKSPASAASSGDAGAGSPRSKEPFRSPYAG